MITINLILYKYSLHISKSKWYTYNFFFYNTHKKCKVHTQNVREKKNRKRPRAAEQNRAKKRNQ